MTQTWWLSFCDSDRPTGEQFLGVAIIDVTDEDAADNRDEVDRRRAQFNQPPPGEDEEYVYYLAAAIRMAHLLGCNPGGEVAGVRLDDEAHFADMDASCPRNRLLLRPELEALGHL